MRRIFIMIFGLFTNIVLSQEHGVFSCWVNIGAGVSSFGHTSSDWSMCGNVGISVRYSEFILKYKRSAHSEFEVLGIQDHAKTHAVMFGYSTRLTSIDYSSICVGIGSLREIVQDRYLGTIGPVNDEYERIEQTATCYPIELEIKILSRYVGFSITAFSEFSRFKPIYGIQMNLLFGYL